MISTIDFFGFFMLFALQSVDSYDNNFMRLLLCVQRISIILP